MNHRLGNSVMYQPLSDNISCHTVTLNEGTDDELKCSGYKCNSCKVFLYWVLTILSLGFFRLVMYWIPATKLKFTKTKCSLSQADAVLLQDQYHQHYVEDVKLMHKEGESTLDHSVCVRQSSSDASLSSVTDINDKTQLIYPGMKSSKRYFIFQEVHYYWNPELETFERLWGLDVGVMCSDFHEKYKGQSAIEQEKKLNVYGSNEIEIKVHSYPRLLVEEVLNPFYIFQLFSVILWMCDDYYYYAGCIIFISVLSILVSLYETRKQSVTLRDMVASPKTTITVCRGHEEYEDVCTTDLTPGDLIVIPSHGCTMLCDAVLTAGNCIVNESMLTGESVPVTKTPIPSHHDETFSPDVHKRHTLFSGTQVIQTRYYGTQNVTAVVVRTGFSTTKGELVRAILYPKPMDFKFYQDSIRFIKALAVIASIGMIYNLYIFIHRGEEADRVILRTLDIVTIVVPPALPAAMTVGTIYAQNRLKKAGIFCISPPRINVCGKLKLVCFDKTGTLTEDGLDLHGVVPLQDHNFLPMVQNVTHLPRGPFLAAMATCHSLTRIEGELTGDPLDMKMFEATEWILEEPGDNTADSFDVLIPTRVRPPTNDTFIVPDNPDLLSKLQMPYEIGIIRQFVFTSSLQRMSVITRTLGSHCMDLYCKGAPEKIASLCKSSTVPDDFHEVLQKYAKKGFRVIAVAWKQLEHKITWHHVQRIKRDQVECDLNFLGLIVLQNMLKPETTPVIHKLKGANIRIVMVTGDNILTAISVARDCAMVGPKDSVIMVNASPPEGDRPAMIKWELDVVDDDSSVSKSETSDTESYQAINIEAHVPSHYHFAMNGRSFGIVREYFPELLPKLCTRGTVFARMAPDQKSQLVEKLQEIGYYVGMCGDGANDCGALKTAHAGISLSEAEASVASPFTSKNPNIECVPTVIREGRAALVTSFGVFKYMALYSMIQFVTVIILYTIESNLSDIMFLYIDLIITTTVAVLMGHTGAYHKLAPKGPKGSLSSVSNLFSIIVQILVVLGFQLGVYLYLITRDWFVPLHPIKDEDNNVCYETTILFYSSSFQYLVLATVFSKGPPYRKRIWTNVPFLVALVVLTSVTTWLTIHPFEFFEDLLEMKHISDDNMPFKITLLLLVACNFVLAYLIEQFLVDSKILKQVISICKRRKEPKSKYKILENELKRSHHWPPVGQVTFDESAQYATSSVDRTVDISVQ